MSSKPFKMGLKIIDKPWMGYPRHFILRAVSKEDAERKIREITAREPRSAEIHVEHMGFRPDRPVPVARYFCEINITGNDGGKRGWFV